MENDSDIKRKRRSWELSAAENAKRRRRLSGIEHSVRVDDILSEAENGAAMGGKGSSGIGGLALLSTGQRLKGLPKTNWFSSSAYKSRQEPGRAGTKTATQPQFLLSKFKPVNDEPPAEQNPEKLAKHSLSLGPAYLSSLFSTRATQGRIPLLTKHSNLTSMLTPDAHQWRWSTLELSIEILSEIQSQLPTHRLVNRYRGFVVKLKIEILKSFNSPPLASRLFPPKAPRIWLKRWAFAIGQGRLCDKAMMVGVKVDGGFQRRCLQFHFGPANLIFERDKLERLDPPCCLSLFIKKQPTISSTPTRPCFLFSLRSVGCG